MAVNGTLTSEDEPVSGEERRTTDVSRITVRLLRGIERLPEGATGAFIFGDKKEPTGSVLVENGRICWAAASGMKLRLTDILVAQARPPLSKDVIEDVYERCRRDGIPLGAGLVAQGVVTPRGLRQALLVHSGDAIALLSEALSREGKVSPAWIANRASRYDAQFTFTSAEILVAVGSRTSKEQAGNAQDVLEHALQDGGAGVAFLTEQRHELPICEVRGEEVGVEGLVDLSRWARAALERCSQFSSCDVVAMTSASRAGSLTWSSEGVVYAALCEDRSNLSYLMSQRARGKLVRER